MVRARDLMPTDLPSSAPIAMVWNGKPVADTVKFGWPATAMVWNAKGNMAEN